jgi:RibD C-terminal domain
VGSTHATTGALPGLQTDGGDCGSGVRCYNSSAAYEPVTGSSAWRSLLALGLADTVEVAVIPVLLGKGIPLLPPPAKQTKLKLTGHRVYKTGIVSLQYG